MFGGYMDGISCISMVKPERYVHDEKKMMAKDKSNTFKNYNKPTSCSSSSTSSIGKNSDISGISLDNNVSQDTEEEVQSSFKSPLDEMQALEDVLPIRKGISRFYNGKSKSFASLADAASSKELTKPENGYAKRRRSLLSYTVSWDNTSRSNSILRSSNGGGIAKRVSSATRNSLALAVAMNSLAASSSSDSLYSEHEMASKSPPPSNCCHVHPQVRLLQADCATPPRGSFSAWRSFSLADLQECASVTNIAQTLQAETDPH